MEFSAHEWSHRHQSCSVCIVCIFHLDCVSIIIFYTEEFRWALCVSLAPCCEVWAKLWLLCVFYQKYFDDEVKFLSCSTIRVFCCSELLWCRKSRRMMHFTVIVTCCLWMIYADMNGKSHWLWLQDCVLVSLLFAYGCISSVICSLHIMKWMAGYFCKCAIIDHLFMPVGFNQL